MRKKLRFVAIALCMAANSYALTNEEFATQVQRQEQIMAANKKALREAEKSCNSLSEQRRGDEPRCIAMQRVNSKDLHSGSSIVKSPKRVW
jgi:hypothetical protein